MKALPEVYIPSQSQIITHESEGEFDTRLFEPALEWPESTDEKREFIIDQCTRVCYGLKPATYPTERVHGGGVYQEMCYNITAWQEMTEALIAYETNDGVVNVLDIIDALPEGYRVLVHTIPTEDGSVEFFPREKVIKVTGLSIPMTCIDLAVAVGEANIDASDSEMYATRKRANSLFWTTNAKVHERETEAKNKGREFALTMLEDILPEGSEAVYGKENVYEAIRQDMESNNDEARRERQAHPFKKTLQRVGRAAILAVTNRVLIDYSQPQSSDG